MRVQNIGFNNTFKSLKLTNNANNFSDTSFYRDPRTLADTTKHLQEAFPDGCDILDFAGSNGEEAISLSTFFFSDFAIACPTFLSKNLFQYQYIAKKSVKQNT